MIGSGGLLRRQNVPDRFPSGAACVSAVLRRARAGKHPVSHTAQARAQGAGASLWQSLDAGNS